MSLFKLHSILLFNDPVNRFLKFFLNISTSYGFVYSKKMLWCTGYQLHVYYGACAHISMCEPKLMNAHTIPLQ